MARRGKQSPRLKQQNDTKEKPRSKDLGFCFSCRHHHLNHQ
jgi:hypothetical protein